MRVLGAWLGPGTVTPAMIEGLDEADKDPIEEEVKGASDLRSRYRLAAASYAARVDEVRKARQTLLSGNARDIPKETLAEFLKILKKEEDALLRFFVGEAKVYLWKATFAIRPDNRGDGPRKLLRVRSKSTQDDKAGVASLVDANDKTTRLLNPPPTKWAPAPKMVADDQIVHLSLTADAKQFCDTVSNGWKKEKDERSFFYRIPASATATVETTSGNAKPEDGKGLVRAFQPVQIAQWGKELSLPVMEASSETLSLALEWHDDQGTFKKIAVSRAKDSPPLKELGEAAAEAVAEMGEVGRLQREVKLLQLEKDRLTALELLRAEEAQAEDEGETSDDEG